MDGRFTDEMDEAWRRYVLAREDDPAKRYGFNPQSVFAAGWISCFNSLRDGEVRASGWAVVDED